MRSILGRSLHNPLFSKTGLFCAAALCLVGVAVATPAPVPVDGHVTHNKLTHSQRKAASIGRRGKAQGTKVKQAALFNSAPTVLPGTDPRTLEWGHQSVILATEGQRQLGLGSLQSAESCFRQAYALDSGNPDALSGLAQTLEREGKEPEAIQAYRVLIYPKQGWGTSLEGDPAHALRAAARGRRPVAGSGADL